jgi:SSS family solute:Na+ symporter
MFWKRTTGHGAFFGLLSGTAAAALTHGLTMAEDKGGWIASVHEFPSTMAQNFWIAIFAWSACFVVTILVSLVTRPKKDAELESLVYGLTKIPREEGVSWYLRPGPLAGVVAVICIALNFLFW